MKRKDFRMSEYNEMGAHEKAGERPDESDFSIALSIAQDLANADNVNAAVAIRAVVEGARRTVGNTELAELYRARAYDTAAFIEGAAPNDATRRAQDAIDLDMRTYAALSGQRDTLDMSNPGLYAAVRDGFEQREPASDEDLQSAFNAGVASVSDATTEELKAFVGQREPASDFRQSLQFAVDYLRAHDKCEAAETLVEIIPDYPVAELRSLGKETT